MANRGKGEAENSPTRRKSELGEASNEFGNREFETGMDGVRMDLRGTPILTP